MNVKTLLDAEIKSEIENLSKVEPGTEEHKIAADALAKLLDKSIEIDKVDLEFQEKAESRDNDYAIKQKQIKDENRDRIVKNVLTGVSMVGGFAITVWGTIKSIEFEKEGTITTIMGRGFIQKLLPKK